MPLRKDVLQVIEQYLQKERTTNPKSVDRPYLLVSQRAPKIQRDAIRRWLEQSVNS